MDEILKKIESRKEIINGLIKNEEKLAARYSKMPDKN